MNPPTVSRTCTVGPDRPSRFELPTQQAFTPEGSLRYSTLRIPEDPATGCLDGCGSARKLGTAPLSGWMFQEGAIVSKVR